MTPQQWTLVDGSITTRALRAPLPEVTLVLHWDQELGRLAPVK